MRVVFAGSPAVAVPTLRAVAAKHEVVAVLTREPTPVGRKRVLTATPVASAAEELGIRVIASNRPDDTVSEQLRDLAADIGVVVAYGAILRQSALDATTHGWLNLHFSLLPEYRGATPLQQTIIDGRESAGLSVFRLVPELDAGDILVQSTSPLGAHETAGEALERLGESGADDVLTALESIADGTAEYRAQEGVSTHAAKLSRQDGELDFAADSAPLYARFKGVTPEPGAWTNTEVGAVKILAMRRMAAEAMTGEPPAPGTAAITGKRAVVAAADGAFELLRVQPPGKPAMDGTAWLRGRGGTVLFTDGEVTA